MKPLRDSVAMVAVAMIVSPTLLSAQPRFEVPLRIGDGTATYTLYFGILPGAHFCIDPSDTINGHGEAYLPPPPPGGVFDERFTCPRSPCPPACFDQGSPNDYRPFVAATQKDTFVFRIQAGTGMNLSSLCWPSGLSAHFTELTICGVDALTDTCVAVPTEFPCRILSGGLVVSVEQTPSTVPGAFALHQNYPNPFNPSTVIKFKVARQTDGGQESSKWVTLRVYDLLGREVATLVNEQLTRGTYERTFDAEDLPSGVYFYRLSSSHITINRKMLLVR